MNWKAILIVMIGMIAFIFLTVAAMQALHNVEQVVAMGISNMYSVRE